MGLMETVDGARMLAILETLARERDGRLNDRLLMQYLDHLGYRLSREVIRNLLTRLSDLRAVIVHRPADGLFIAEITQSGIDHVERRGELSGVARPEAPYA